MLKLKDFEGIYASGIKSNCIFWMKEKGRNSGPAKDKGRGFPALVAIVLSQTCSRTVR